MATTTKARTARKAHRCDDCRRRAIAPGHRYLRHVLFPGDINTSGKPWTSIECVACAADRDDTAPLLAAGACATYCCGDLPCARPFGHDLDHSCRRCLGLATETRPSRPHRDEPSFDRPITTVHLPAANVPA